MPVRVSVAATPPTRFGAAVARPARGAPPARAAWPLDAVVRAASGQLSRSHSDAAVAQRHSGTFAPRSAVQRVSRHKGPGSGWRMRGLTAQQGGTARGTWEDLG